VRRVTRTKARVPATRAWVLTGMGGLGKSTVALAVAQAARTAGWWVWWVNASDAASLTGGMLEVLGQLGAPESVLRPVREGTPTAADRAWEFLNSGHRAGQIWLLVLDNADHPAVLAAHGSSTPADHAGWIRPASTGVVIVTTRVKDRSIWGPGLAMRELTPLDDDTSAQVLTDLARDISDPGAEQARQLGRRLGGLPLALHLAGAYLASPFARWHTFADYRRALDGVELPTALADLDDSGAQARVTIQQTWELSLDALAADGRPQARPLLLLLSCYAPATAIPAGLLRAELLAGMLNPDSSNRSSTSAEL
jgi:NB-ARC domain